MDPVKLTAALKSEAGRLGFDLAGACPAKPPPRIGRFREWLAAGYSGQMRYLADRAAAYEDPSHLLPGVQGILVLGMAYRTVEPVPPGQAEAAVSRYAWGIDYHKVIGQRLRSLAKAHLCLTPQARVRGVVDTAPLLEREFAQLAGLGWIGKNTLLVTRQFGSWVFLAALLTTEPLDFDQPGPEGVCGSCRACLDACPTGALVRPYWLDARRCLSYLTIELRAAIPRDLREPIGQRLFGCDACQEACPWNRRAAVSRAEAFRPLPGMNPVGLVELLAMEEDSLRQRFGPTALWRARRAGLLRNAAIVLGNRPDQAALSALMGRLDDAAAVVRGACAWALGRQRTGRSLEALRKRLAVEEEPEVCAEIEAGLGPMP